MIFSKKCFAKCFFVQMHVIFSTKYFVNADLVDDLTPVYHDKGWYPPNEEGFASTHIESGRNLQVSLQGPIYASSEWSNAADTGTCRVIKHDHELTEAELGKSILKKRCKYTRGKWCGKYESQASIPYTEPPRGSVQCKNKCNGVGNCNYDIGVCDCPAGWTGEDCSVRDKRPCGNGERPKGSHTMASHIDEEGRDLGWHKPGWMASRCAGICDDDLAMCWCGEGKYKRVNAPKGSPPGTPPVQRGRPLSEFCGKVREDKDGRPTTWGNVPYKKVYGPEGWCMVDKPSEEGNCDNCMIDNIGGKYCDTVKEAYCPSQCSGHGDCNLGFCKCQDGWYGLDCSRKAAAATLDPSDVEAGRKPWLKSPGLGDLPPAARSKEDPAAPPSRKRPLIYIYDTPPPLTTRMLQYRLVWKACIWRHFSVHNESLLHDWLYGVETYFHEMLLNSPHRTFDPEEADYFYVPLYVTCYFWPIIGWADHPWWYGPQGSPRPMHGANMMLELQQWIQSHYGKYWRRRGGRDHIWLTAADEGACWMPREVYQNSIVLTHWGRMDLEHSPGTAFARDNYHQHYQDPKYQPVDWVESILGHPCYNASKDLVIPSLKLPVHYSSSPLLGAEPLKRDILLFFKGDVGSRRDPPYSRGIRQKLYKMGKEQNLTRTHRIVILSGEDHSSGSYSSLLARSIFCLVAPGDGWSARAEDAVLHGCIPLIIMDNVHTIFETMLDWDAFSIRVREFSVEDVPYILSSVTDDQIARMQRRLTLVWHRFAYTTGSLIQKAVKDTIDRNLNEMPSEKSTLPPHYPVQRVKEYPFQDDAFGTIMQWLYAKIPETR
ncbi:hypothetical protein CEUSTIGMA_g4303.t1 [Chlamydomonas eustigma]|uniref:EGF-like domain-containing protein n=1 Tax=Chlamydomonas eustigma TaxID=1157962 RepID=A0A250X197_9CHLO|nr:hypothetical protein CEUSTIGMA_g4303.t1 [Chlamydomonas eustigma]|eukprot:GAX76857.1 hypothetical protein CEUSTIGMA_g4303.t1 [Chlamydomonas eustigma]